MLRATFALPVLALTLGACAGHHEHAQPAAAPDSHEHQMPQPTAEHRMLLDGVGTWEGTLVHFMPGMPETAAPAKEVVEAVGEFWTQSRFTCDFMGMPYLGVGSLGYDPDKKKMVGTWIDNMSSYMALMEGTVDASGKKITMHFDAPDMTGKIVPHRIETVWGKDTYTSTFFQGDGKGTKSMVIEMKRKS